MYIMLCAFMSIFIFLLFYYTIFYFLCFSVIILDILCSLLRAASIDGRFSPLAACHCSDYCAVHLLNLFTWSIKSLSQRNVQEAS